MDIPFQSKPDSAKVATFKEMDAPSNKSELRTIMEMTTYLSKFAPILETAVAQRHRIRMGGNTSSPGIPEG